MSLLIDKIEHSYRLGIWDIQESASELEKYISDFVSIPKIKNNQRLCQWMAARNILKDWDLNDKIICDENGKPHFSKASLFVSISHCENKAAAIVSENKCGVDVETYTNKAERISKRFLSDEEKGNCLHQDDYTIYWMAKEAIYKAFGENEITFKRDIFVQNISFEENNDTTCGIGSIKKKQKKEEYNLYFKKFADFASCTAVLKN